MFLVVGFRGLILVFGVWGLGVGYCFEGGGSELWSLYFGGKGCWGSGFGVRGSGSSFGLWFFGLSVMV